MEEIEYIIRRQNKIDDSYQYYSYNSNVHLCHSWSGFKVDATPLYSCLAAVYKAGRLVVPNYDATLWYLPVVVKVTKIHTEEVCFNP